MDYNKIIKVLKPDWRKLLLWALVMGGLNYLIIKQTYILDARILVGFPLGFWPIGSFMIWPNTPPPLPVEFSWMNFIIDIIFWYIIAACIIFFFCDIIKK